MSEMTSSEMIFDQWAFGYAKLADADKAGEFFQNLAICAASGKVDMKSVMDAVFLLREKGPPTARKAWDIASLAEKCMDKFYGSQKEHKGRLT